MIAAVQTGAFISTEDAVYFAAGNDPNNWQLSKAYRSPAIPFCKCQNFVTPSDLGIENGLLSVLFGTTAGPCVGFPSGEVINLTERNLKMPDCQYFDGAIMTMDDSTVIQSMRA
jgi:hypothetical protein